MSNIRDSAFPASNRYRRSPPDVNAHSGTYSSAQSSRTVLPPLSSAFAAPYSDLQHDSLPSRMSPSRNEVFSPSFPPAYWNNNGHATMAGHPPYNYSSFEHFDTRHQAQASSYPLRQSPAIPAHQDTLRRAPPLTIPPVPRDNPWESDYINSSFPANFGLNNVGPETTGLHSSNYPSNYDPPYHNNAHSAAYPPFHPNIDTRHHPHAPHPMPFAPEIHQSSHRNSHQTEWGPPQRAESHLVSPYARTHRESMQPSPQEPSPVDYPSVKKKRKRADAAQLKVLNEVYARTAFPTTEERLELANRLDMSARSVQIWFQNKRQATRQSRTTTNALPPILHHPYAGGPSSGPSPLPSSGRPGAEVAVSPSSHGGSYTAHSSTPGSHRSQREISPPVPPSDPAALRRVRSPEGNGRPRRQTGHQY
ncbi:uncharacterized protein FOMMEDRAFT_156503 [Fomitiporia mediterranea MF3/22]|uniref:uncharacterized protein n=1 Tax=Fomitiporia mediterranea (strain MF3/22) TaxID=694068 RepID=UPI00044084A2|nr:uncharacterized protein FOMMEDRAFT_156503 [Fomitiporia mediterranea MF3/22]EJD03130.1 hypothetical protein FOMMEDRAFT_156503 [Fomitiporia mediterranea MF3/22]